MEGRGCLIAEVKVQTSLQNQVVDQSLDHFAGAGPYDFNYLRTSC
jgi:hypothetical protein